MTKKKDAEHKPQNHEEEQTAAPHQEQEAAPQEKEAPQAEDYYDQLLRLKADFENYRKRTEREKPLFIRFGKAEVIKKLLPLYDTLLKAEAEVNKKDAEAKDIKQGLKMIFEEFNKFFKSEGVVFECSKGKPYNPMTHEVITTIPCADAEDGLVKEELCTCATYNGEVLRPAQVIVGKKQEDTQE